MPIPDPHAIPENAAACEEYLHEADAAWERSDNDAAYDLYLSLRQSQFVAVAAFDHAAYRLGLIAQSRNDIDLAVHYFSSTPDPAAADALRALTNATTNDPTPDPDTVPTTAEQVYAWTDAAAEAGNAANWDRMRGLNLAASQSAAVAPAQLASCYNGAAVASEHLGDQESAVYYYEQAIPLTTVTEDADQIRERLKHLGGAQVGAAGTSPADIQVASGINAYENGDAVTARTDLQAALHLEGPEDQKARAHYYLAAMDYQAGHYADARNHLDAAISNAPEPEQSWAQAMLQWRWDEHVPAAQIGTPPSTPSSPYSPTEP
jgi:tetratricopeptide (TPR) repeat protein